MRRFLPSRVVRRIRDRRGTNLIEAAIITPMLLMVTFGIVEFGALFWVYLALENGVSIASRYAVTGNLVAGQDRAGSIKATMRNATPQLTIPDSAFTFNHMSPGGGGWAGGVGGPGDIEKVTVTYTWNIMTPLLRPFFTGGRITFVVDSAMKNEGRWTE